MPSSSFADDSKLLLSQACSELQRRLRAGEPCSAEELLPSYPALASQARHALTLIRAEWLARRELGQSPSVSEYRQRFPQWREQLDSVLRADIAPAEYPTVADATATAGAPGSDPAGHRPRPEAVLLDRYEVFEELGHGAMGYVHTAYDRRLQRWVAVKIMRGGVLASEAEVARFLREAQAPAALNHRHIVPVYDSGTHAGAHFYVMKLAAGGSLSRRRAEFAAPRAAAALMEKVARAMGAMHAAGTIHRDLKPGNVLFDESDEPLVADFGLAKRANDPDMTLSGQALGTPHYMAPEQASGRSDEATAASDVWALGVILYELLTGKQPFAGGQPAAVMHSVLSVEPTRPRKMRREVPRDLEAIVLRCLQKETGDRYADANALADALRAWLEGRPLPARPVPWPRRLRRSLRKITRVQVLALLLIAALGASLYLLSLLQDHWAPNAAGLAARVGRLQRGDDVELVPAIGLPDYYRFWTSRNRAPLLPRLNQPLQYIAADVCLLELLPDPQWEEFALAGGSFSKTLKTGAAERRPKFYTGKHEDGASRDSARRKNAVGRGVAGDYWGATGSGRVA